MTPIQRLSALEDCIDQYTRRISRQKGEIQALQAALNAIFLVIGANPAIREAVASQMERSIALNLASSTDQSLVDGFDSAATLVCEAMNQAQSRTEPTSSQLLEDATSEYDSIWANMQP
jgi:hypothetical protein